MRKTRPLAEGTETGCGAALDAASGFLSEDDLRGGKSSVYQQKEGATISAAPHSTQDDSLSVSEAQREVGLHVFQRGTARRVIEDYVVFLGVSLCR